MIDPWLTMGVATCHVIDYSEWLRPMAHSGLGSVSSGQVLKKLRTRVDSEISGGRETKYWTWSVCV